MIELDNRYLYQICNPTRFSIPNEYTILADQMLEFTKKHGGIGLAANQVGHNLRLFVMSLDERDYKCFNPIILNKSKSSSTSIEGCLSFPELALPIERNDRIDVSWFDEEGKLVIETLEGLAARCFQHELDHLNGITIMERKDGIKK